MNSNGNSIILAWEDDEVSTGAQSLKDYLLARQYGQADKHPQVYVNDKGTLKPVLIVIDPLVYSDDDYAYPTVRLWAAVEGVNVQDEHSPFYVFGLRIDGRV